MTMRNWAWLAAAMLATWSMPAVAASPAEIASTLAPEVIQVVSGGLWDDGGKTGGYRAVLVAPTEAGGRGAELYLEWIAAGKDGAAPSVVATSPIKEVNDLKLADALLSMEFEKANEFTLFVEPNDPAKDSGNSYTVVATTPGKYNFTLGAPPE
jgi:hypothetical protein